LDDIRTFVSRSANDLVADGFSTSYGNDVSEIMFLSTPKTTPFVERARFKRCNSPGRVHPSDLTRPSRRGRLEWTVVIDIWSSCNRSNSLRVLFTAVYDCRRYYLFVARALVPVYTIRTPSDDAYALRNISKSCSRVPRPRVSRRYDIVGRLRGRHRHVITSNDTVVIVIDESRKRHAYRNTYVSRSADRWRDVPSGVVTHGAGFTNVEADIQRRHHFSITHSWYRVHLTYNVSIVQGGPFKPSATGNTLTLTSVITYSYGSPRSKHQFTRIRVMGLYTPQRLANFVVNMV